MDIINNFFTNNIAVFPHIPHKFYCAERVVIRGLRIYIYFENCEIWSNATHQLNIAQCFDNYKSGIFIPGNDETRLVMQSHQGVFN